MEDTLAPDGGGPSSRGGSLDDTIGGAPLVTGDDSHRQPGADLRPGQSIGRYVILERLGVGGMGVVFSAYDPELDRRVAIKVLHPESDTANGQERLLREARALAKLSHPNVVAVHDVGEIGGSVFVAMEYVVGKTLGGWLNAQARSQREILAAFSAAGRGLAVAHATGLVHRDFKPDNVMMGDDGRVRVMDFGLARVTGERTLPAETSNRPAMAQSLSLTRTGAIMGTPAYMAPEQHRGEEATPNTDQFSFCVALHEALYGARPFGGSTFVELVTSVTFGQRQKPPPGRDVPGWLRGLIDRGLATDPAARWSSMDVLLEGLGNDPKVRRRRWMFGMVGAGVLGLGGLWALQFADPQRCRNVEDAATAAWNAESREVIASAFASTGLARAPDAWRRIEPRVEDYVQRWISARRETCLASADGDLSQFNERRIQCLEERKDVISALVGTLKSLDAALVDKVGDIVAGLPRIEACADADTLMAEVALPDDPAVAEQVRDLRARMTALLPLAWRGEYQQEIQALGELRTEADAIAYRPLIADLDFRLGVALDYQGEYAGAGARLEECFFVAQATRSHLGAARCASKLVHLVGDHLGRHAEALHWGKHGDAVIEAGKLDDQIRGTLANNRGNVLLALDRDDEALEAFRTALELWTRELGPDHVDLAVPQGNIASVYARQGRLDQAIQAHQAALELRIRHSGENHPQIAGTRQELGLAYFDAGRVPEAIKELRMALALRGDTVGAEHPQTIDSMAHLGRVLSQTPARDEGLELLRKALSLIRPGQGTMHVAPEKIQSWLDATTVPDP